MPTTMEPSVGRSLSYYGMLRWTGESVLVRRTAVTLQIAAGGERAEE